MRPIALTVDCHIDEENKEWHVVFMTIDSGNTFIAARKISMEKAALSKFPFQYTLGDELGELCDSMKAVAIERFAEEHKACHAIVPRSASEAQMKAAQRKIKELQERHDGRDWMGTFDIADLWELMVETFEKENREKLS